MTSTKTKQIESIMRWIDETSFESLLFNQNLLGEFITDNVLLEKYNPTIHTILRALRTRNENMVEFLLKYKLTDEQEIEHYRKVVNFLSR